MADLSIPDGFGPLSITQIPDGFAPAPGYTSQFFPVSVDSGGSYHPAVPGLLQRAYSAATAPGDVFTGKTPILGADSQANPDLINRATDFAGFFGPQSTALRSGEVIPGEIASPTVPTAQQLKGAASARYDAARGAGLDIAGTAVADMARQIQTGLQGDHGIIAKTAPKTFAVLDELASPPQGGVATITGLEAARRGLGAISGEAGAEGLAAQKAVRGIDDFFGSLNPQSVVAGTASPEIVANTLRDARGDYSAAMRSNDLTGTLDRANTGIAEQAEARAHASNSGANIGNSIRQRVASFLQRPENVAGFSQPEIDALNAIVDGGMVQNGARKVGNLLGGGGGLGALLTSTIGHSIGSHFGPEGGLAGAALPAVGYAAKGFDNFLARRGLNAVDEMTRMRSPLYDAMQAQGLLSPAMNRNSAVLRSLLPGLLSPPVPQSQPMPRGLLDEWA